MVPDVFVVPYEVPSEEFLADLLGTSLDGLFTDNARYLLDLLCVGISGNSDSMTWRGEELPYSFCSLISHYFKF